MMGLLRGLRNLVSVEDGERGGAALGLILVVVGLILMLLVNFVLGLVLLIIGIVLFFVPGVP
jgi:hypothetical protein